MLNFSYLSSSASLFYSNIEDTARDAGSVDVDEESLYCMSITTILQLKIHVLKGCFVLKLKSLLNLTLW
jgi:hypothetical protein